MIGDALFAGLLISLLAGGQLSNLGRINLKGTWFVVISVLVQYGGQFIYDRGAGWVGDFGALIYMSSLAAVLWFVWINRRLPGFWLVGVGVFSNVLVIAANGGQMPVSLQALQTAGLAILQTPIQTGTVFTHQAMNAHTVLAGLGDFIVLSAPYPRPKVISIGDILLAIGVITFVVVVMRPWPLRNRNKE